MYHGTTLLTSTALLLNLILLPGMASGSAPARLADFFKPVAAKVVMQVESGVLVDKGSADGIAPGDILTVVENEKLLHHPQTGQLLDTLTIYGSHLVATRVKADISYCRELSPGEKIVAGTPLHRYGNVPVFFEDVSGSGFRLFQSLRQDLPQLRWEEYRLAKEGEFPEQKAALVIRHTSDRILVLNQDRKILFSEKRPSTGSGVEGNGTSSQRETSLAENPSRAGGGATISPAGLPSPDGKTWSIQRFDWPEGGEIEALQVSDLDQDGRADILFSVGGTLIFGHLQDQKLIEKSRFTDRGWDQIIDISILDLNDDGMDEVIVSGLDGSRALGRILRWRENGFVTVTTVPMLMGIFQPMNKPPMLIGMNDGEFLDIQPRIFKIALAEGQLVKNPLPLDNVQHPYGFATFPVDEGKPWLILLSARDKLRLLDGEGQVRWESSEHFGGSIQNIKIPLPGSRNSGSFDRYFFRSRLYKTQRDTVLVAQHDDPGLFKNSTNYENGRLVELAWNGNFMEEVGRSQPLGGMISDFDLYDLKDGGPQEVIASVIYRQGGLFQKPFSGLVILTPR